MQTILVFGSTGQVAQEIQSLRNEHQNYHFEFIGREKINFESKKDIDTFLLEKIPKETIGLINAVAYTAVDLAETESDKAYLVNSEAPALMAEYTRRLGIKLVHFSTDFVFDGLKPTPYKENDEKNPLSVYGKTKSIGEDLVLERDPNAIVIRTSWVYSKYGKNFLKTMVRLAKEKEQVSVVDDQIGTPTWAKDLAKLGIQALASDQSGIFHFSNEGVASWYDFAYEIISRVNPNCRVLPIPSEAYPTPAKRPSYSVLSKKKTRESFSTESIHWKERVSIVLDQLNC
ncbi:dTDP-4-dehydrorhamnose reductase [Leptospira jelokensis]|uniref:dTDP-4-dehydrorhamnose reductase n=1 Tax=Leptospira jelokensis TaxID=2484931 RepID=UPI00109185C8|nr:dTDP-4-dehydrorhamnose reductase [Leptospira jelokensis]TGL99245.1 dTDP-4-dehydrorhamnose reductase [Leptospira jelokensis]